MKLIQNKERQNKSIVVKTPALAILGKASKVTLGRGWDGPFEGPYKPSWVKSK